MSNKSNKNLTFSPGEEGKRYTGESSLFGLCQSFGERHAGIMERKQKIEQSILAEFGYITSEIEGMGCTGIDHVIDKGIVPYFPISVIPIGGFAEKYPIIRRRLAEEYFLPKMPLFFDKWKEYLYEKVQSLDANKSEALEHTRGYQFNTGYDRKKECFVLVFSRREFY